MFFGLIPATRYCLSGILILAFLANTFGPICPIACSANGSIPSPDGEEFRLPAPGVRVGLSPEFSPSILKGLKVHPDNPFRFDFIMDQGDSPSLVKEGDRGSLKQEATKLIKYFLASLTIPEKDLWVNLSPYEKDRIIPQSFGLTEMGRDLLAEDYMLKQITASLIYPEGETGKRFWKRVYEEAAKKFGTTNIPVNTFNKVWIVPEKAVVYENAKAGTAYVVESKLKVMLEQDYLALSHSVIASEAKQSFSTVIPAKAGIQDTSSLGSQIVREIVIPELTKEVNEDKNFVQLRQVYNSLILATWYKKKIKDSILSQIYSDKNKVAGVEYQKSIIPGGQPGDTFREKCPQAGCQASKPLNVNAPQGNHLNDVESIYQRYLQAFKKGVYNYIKEEPDPMTQETIPRKYFSGGTTFDAASMAGALIYTKDAAVISQTAQLGKSDLIDVNANFVTAGSQTAPQDFAMQIDPKNFQYEERSWKGEGPLKLSSNYIERFLPLVNPTHARIPKDWRPKPGVSLVAFIPAEILTQSPGYKKIKDAIDQSRLLKNKVSFSNESLIHFTFQGTYSVNDLEKIRTQLKNAAGFRVRVKGIFINTYVQGRAFFKVYPEFDESTGENGAQKIFKDLEVPFDRTTYPAGFLQLTDDLNEAETKELLRIIEEFKDEDIVDFQVNELVFGKHNNDLLGEWSEIGKVNLKNGTSAQLARTNQAMISKQEQDMLFERLEVALRRSTHGEELLDISERLGNVGSALSRVIYSPIIDRGENIVKSVYIDEAKLIYNALFGENGYQSILSAGDELAKSCIQKVENGDYTSSLGDRETVLEDWKKALEGFKKQKEEIQSIGKSGINMNDGSSDNNVDIMVKALDRLERAIESLRSGIEIAEGKESTETTTFSDILKIIPENFKTNLIIEGDSYLSSEIKGNPLALASVIYNLIINAHKAAEEKGIESKVTLRLTEKDDEMVVELSDNGPGLPPNYLDIDQTTGRQRVFNLNNTTRGGIGGGTGLGTTEAFFVVPGITAANSPGGGATFTMPFQKAIQSGDSAQLASQQELIGISAQIRNFENQLKKQNNLPEEKRDPIAIKRFLIQMERLKIELLERIGIIHESSQVLSFLNGGDPLMSERVPVMGQDYRSKAGHIGLALGVIADLNIGFDRRISSRNYLGTIVANFGDVDGIKKRLSEENKVRTKVQKLSEFKPNVFYFKNTEYWYMHYSYNTLLRIYKGPKASDEAEKKARQDYADALNNIMNDNELVPEGSIFIVTRNSQNDGILTDNKLKSLGYKDILPERLPLQAIENLKESSSLIGPLRVDSDPKHAVVVDLGGEISVYEKPNQAQLAQTNPAMTSDEETIQKFNEVPPGIEKVVDMGSGGAEFLEAYRKNSKTKVAIIGYETVPRGKQVEGLVKRDARDTGIDSNSVDKVTINMPGVPALRKDVTGPSYILGYLKEAMWILKSGGQVYIVTENWDMEDTDKQNVRDDLKDLGFEIERDGVPFLNTIEPDYPRVGMMSGFKGENLTIFKAQKPNQAIGPVAEGKGDNTQSAKVDAAMKGGLTKKQREMIARGLTYDEAREYYLNWKQEFESQGQRPRFSNGFWQNRDTVANYVLAVLDVNLPGFQEARKKNDIKTMTQLYLSGVKHYPGSQVKFFEDTGLSGFLTSTRFFRKKDSPGALIEWLSGRPELKGWLDIENKDALWPWDIEDDYWTENTAVEAVSNVLKWYVLGFKNALSPDGTKKNSDITALANHYNQMIEVCRIEYPEQFKRFGALTFFIEKGRLLSLTNSRREFLDNKFNSPATLMRLVIRHYPQLTGLLALLHQSKGNEAMLSPEERISIANKTALSNDLGGIDLNKINLESYSNGSEIKFHIDPAMLQQLQNAPGFVPVIISVKPLEDLQGFLGIVNQT